MNSAVLATLLLAGLPATALPRYSVTSLDGGVPMVHVPAPQDSQLSSLRLVVRAGGFQDPAGKAGLAHLLEHLVLQGSYDQGEGTLWNEVRAKGGTLNAFTTTGMTIYALDAPHDVFLPLAESLTRTVTNPALRMSRFDRERDVVAAEQQARGLVSLMDVLDMLLFNDRQGDTVIGTRESRRAITLEDVVAFYGRHYVPANVRIMVVSRANAAEVQQALERSFLLAPEDAKPAAAEPVAPTLPMQQKTRSFVTVTAFGYRLPADTQQQCRPVAALLEHRLRERLVVQDPVLSEVHVRCHFTRGQLFLMAFGFTRNLLGSNVPVVMEEVFLSAARTRPSAEEEKVLAQRGTAQLENLRDDPPALAMGMALAAGEREDLEQAVRDELTVPRLDWAPMEKLMKESFRERQQVVLHVSPFEGG